MKVLAFEAARCLSCHACELACSLAHLPGRSLFEAVMEGEEMPARLFVLPGKPFAGVVHCRHCLSAPCLKACPTQAIRRAPETGAVVVEGELCIGCGDCVLACPFGALSLYRGKALKCDLCGGEPACVKACPTSALRFVSPEEEGARKRMKASRRLFSPLRRK